MKVTLVPLQILPLALEAITTAGVTEVLMLMVMEFELAVEEEAQAALDVMTQVTTSPLDSEAVVNVALLLPVLVPLIFHW